MAQRISRAGAVNTIYVRAQNADNVDSLKENIENLLYKLYENEDYYRVTSQQAMLETLSSVTDTLSIVLAGITGIIIGCLGITIIGKLDLVPAVYSIKWILISRIVSLLIGVVFGLFPAYKAAKMDPIKALRTN